MLLLLILTAVIAALTWLRRPLLAVAPTVMFWIAIPGVANATDGTAPADSTLQSIRLSALTVTLLVSLLIPIVNGILTREGTPSSIKGVLTIVLNAGNALIVGAVLNDGTAVFSEATLVNALIGAAISIASYSGVYKPIGLTSTPNGDGKALLNRTND